MEAVWETKRLSNLAYMCLGKMLDQRKNKGEFLPYLANINVRWGHIDLEDLREMRFEEREFDRYGLKYGDIVMCEGGEPGRCAIWKDQNPSMMIQKAIHRIRSYEGVDSFFLYYALLNIGLKGHFEGFFTGAAIKHLTGESLAKIEVDIPPLPIQQKIVGILSAYDDLIENNLKRIKLLEEMAQITYEEWFIRLRFPSHETTPTNHETSLPEGWAREELKDYIKFLKGKKVDEIHAEYSVGLTKIMLLDSLETGQFKYTHANKHVQTKRGDLVMCMDGARSSWVFYAEEGVVGSTMAKIQSEIIPTSLLYHFFKSHIEWLQTNNTGAAIPHANKAFINKIKFLKPVKDILLEWNGLISPINSEVWNLREQNQLLREARDTLLPRLMTGMIDVEQYNPAALRKEAA